MGHARWLAVSSTGWTRNGKTLLSVSLGHYRMRIADRISLNMWLDCEKMWLNVRVNFLQQHVVKCRLCDIVAVRNDVLHTIYDGLAQGLLESPAVQRNAVSLLLLLTCCFVWCYIFCIMSVLAWLSFSQAMDLIRRSKDTKFVIFSDSMSSLEALNGFKIELDLVQKLLKTTQIS